MILALDVGYSDIAARVAVGSCPSFLATEPANFTVTAYDYPTVAVEYQPGRFYRRELPFLLRVPDHYPKTDINCLIIDGYVDLTAERPGLGAHLSEELGGNIPVIGVAKNYFRDTDAIPVLRGDSQKALYVSARGLSQEKAAGLIRQMAGPYRIPDFLRAVDRASKKW